MGLIEQEIYEIRQLNQRLAAGDLKPAQVNAHVALYSQVEKRAKLMFQIAALGAKFGEKSIQKLQDSQLINNNSVIDISVDSVLDKIECPDQNKIITRGECKKYSEATGHLGTCQSCRNFKTTRKLLKQSIK